MKKIILYTTPNSHFCDLAREYFNERAISFEEIDISRDKAGAAEMAKISEQFSVPVIKIDNEIIVGFDEKRIHEALA